MKTITMCALLMLVGTSVGCDRHDSWKTESGLEITEIVEGTGAPPEDGEIISIRYTGWYLDGDQFYSTEKLDEPIKVRFGRDELLPGLEEGVASMRKGGKRILLMPPKLAFGEEGRPGVVPEDQWVKFEVELVDIEPGPPPVVPWNEAGMEITRMNSGLQFVDFELGEGKTPRIGDTVVVHYAGFLDDGTLFDTTYYGDRPLEFELSAERLIQGWVEALLTMSEGGKRKVIVPPFLAYGERGFGDAIPPNATLIFDITLVEVIPRR
jgi:FKBP-type peptidyl-prolyl cis-trans isomerase